MERWFLLLLAFVLNGGFLVGFESQVDRSVRNVPSLDERVQLLRGNDGSWRIPDGVNSRTAAADRQGLRGDPLTIHEVSGEILGEVFQIRSAQDYVGLLLVANEKGTAKGLSSGFSDVEWPVARVSREFTLNDLNNPLFEPKFYLILDEDRLLLRVNLGKKELELDGLYLDVDEIRRGNSRDSERALQR
jgi:hypothetical protein